MNRRSFLGFLSSGLVGAATTVHFPVRLLGAAIQEHAAIEIVGREFDRYVNLRGGNICWQPRPIGLLLHPTSLHVGSELFAAFEQHVTTILHAMHCAYVGPSYEHAPVVLDSTLKPWECRAVGR